MKTQRSLALPILNVLAIFAQGATYWLWQKGGVKSFQETYTAFGTEMPVWTRFVFATWSWWWLAPVACLAIFLFVLRRKERGLHAVLWSFVGAVVVLLGMWYAMYPIHAMSRGL
jgi:hypothetical protein